MPPNPAIAGHALADVVARPSGDPASGYGALISDTDIARQRALQSDRGHRLYPANHAAALACSRLDPLTAPRRTGLVVATSAAGRHAVSRSPAAFLAPPGAGSARSRRLDVLVAVSRFVSGGLAQDVATALGTQGPELCLPGDCGLAPLAVAGLFIETGRADAMVVVAVEPRPDDPASYEAVAVLIQRTGAQGAIALPPVSVLTTDDAACVPAIRDYLSRRAAAAGHGAAVVTGARCAVRWAGRASTPANQESWVDAGRGLLDECHRLAGTRDLGVVAASFLDLSPEHALRAVERGAAPDEITREARRMTFEGALRHRAADRGLRGPYVSVTGIPGASLLALAIAEDLIRCGATPSVAVLAGDWVGDGATRALSVLGCPDRPWLRSAVAAVLIERAGDHPGGRRVRSFTARRDACADFAAEVHAHAPSHTMASGCTGADLDAARQFAESHAPAASGHVPCPAARDVRFLGADAVIALADLLDLPGPAALSVRNELGGSGLVLLDAAD